MCIRDRICVVLYYDDKLDNTIMSINGWNGGIGLNVEFSYGELYNVWAEAVCFEGDTLVKAEDGPVPISKLNEGDYVYSENKITGEKGLQRVEHVFVNHTSTLLKIEFSDCVVDTTPTHPFWTINRGWVPAAYLRLGDKLVSFEGNIVNIKKIQIILLDEPITVYNLEISNWHTYFVTQLELLVHNKCKQADDGTAISDLRPIPGYLQREASVSRLKKQAGKSSSNLQYNPRTGRVYAVPRLKGSGRDTPVYVGDIDDMDY